MVKKNRILTNFYRIYSLFAQMAFEEVNMSMQEIAAKIERKQLLDELELLKKLDNNGKEVVTKEEILRVDFPSVLSGLSYCF